MIYHLAAGTGLRAAEVASLAPASFDYTAATVTVEAAYSKHRREDVLDLRADLVALLLDYSARKPRRSPLWPGTWSQDGGDLVRLDLAQPGIPYIDADGLVYHFHALRHQFISDLAVAGVHPADAQALARHSTITLTMDHYTHVRRVNLRAALDRLPDLAPEQEPEDKKDEGPEARSA